MTHDNNKISNEIAEKTKKANLKLAVFLGIIVLLGMSSTFFMLSEKI